MTDIRISCSGCNAEMGLIRDAKLRKEIRYLCGNCNEIRVRQQTKLLKLKKTKRGSGEILDDI